MVQDDALIAPNTGCLLGLLGGGEFDGSDISNRPRVVDESVPEVEWPTYNVSNVDPLGMQGVEKGNAGVSAGMAWCTI